MAHFLCGDDIISRHPHRVFDKVVSQGYSLRYGVSTGPMASIRDLVVQALLEDEVVADAEFWDAGEPCCQNVRVNERHRRKGLANSLYVFAERFYGKPLYDKWGNGQNSIQSALGRALWNQPDRPFGPRPR